MSAFFRSLSSTGQGWARTSLTLGVTAWALVGCGGSSFVVEQAAAAAGASGTTAGQPAAGGTGSGAAGSGGGTRSQAGGPGTCSLDSDCIAAVDLTDPCYSACSAPVPGTRSQLSSACVKEWQPNTTYPIPAECAATSPVACPALCAQVSCARARCNSGTCALTTWSDPALCTGAAGAGQGGSGPQPSCQTLQQTVTLAIEKARQCTRTAGCPSPTQLKDTCGCAQPGDSSRPLALKAAQDALEAYKTAGCNLPCPAITCPAPTSTAICEATSGATTSGTGQCTWTAG